MAANTALRTLPAVDRLLAHSDGEALVRQFGHDLTVEALRIALDEARAAIRAEDGESTPTEIALLSKAKAILTEWLAPTLRRVINATGVIIHTNLGRAPLSRSAIESMLAVAQGYSTLEFDLQSGERGSRRLHAEAFLRRLTGAEAALVVNNNAAVVLLTLSALAGRTPEHPFGQGVIVSRGQQVEIGGGFRVPEVMAQSGARLIEVGTTNRTRLSDYEDVIDSSSAAILRAHRSNFAMTGFVAEPSLSELAGLAHRRGLFLLDDLGSGALLDTRQFGLAAEPMVQESLQAGADVVMFSGDKLLGGPQAGVILGRADLIDRIARCPLARAVRADKLCLAALAATLGHYLKGEALTHIPIWQMISAPLDAIRERTERWQAALHEKGLPCQIVEGRSAIGGGSLPGETLPSILLAINLPAPDRAAAHLRACDPPVIARIEDDRLIIDPRTILPGDESELLAALETLMHL